MNAKLLNCIVAWGVAGAAPALANPPVQVEVVEEGDDLFDPPAPPAKPAARKGVKGRADKLFEELEREEAKRGTKRVRARVSRNGNVAEVEVVVGDDDTPPIASTPAPPATPATPTVVVPQGSVQPPPPDPTQRVVKPRKRSWWSRKGSWVQKGDVLIFGSATSYGGGGLFGLGGEVMVSDTFGLRLMGIAGSFGHKPPGSGFDANLNIFEGGQWAIQRDVNPDTAKGGFAHLTELNVTAHLFRRSRFDVYAALGAAHLGYEVNFRNGDERGGAFYGRVGAGARIHVRRFFFGADFGWYPLEVARYTIEEAPDDDDSADFREVTNRFEAKRFNLTAQVGFRF